MQLYDDSAVCEKIKNAIKQKGWTYTNVAEIMGTTPQYIYAILSKSRKLTSEKIIEFAHVLGLSLDFLIFETKNILRFCPDIKSENVVSSMTLVDAPHKEMITLAKNYGFDGIENVNEQDYLVVTKEVLGVDFSSEKVIIVELNEEPPILAKAKTINGITVFYFNGKPPIITDNYRVIGIVKKIIRTV